MIGLYRSILSCYHNIGLLIHYHHISKQLTVLQRRTMSVVGGAGVTTDDQSNADERRKAGEFVRGVSSAREWIQKQAVVVVPSLSPPLPKYPAERDRYHLIVAYNCPWCHRVLLTRSVLGLEDVITVDVVFPNRSTEDDSDGRPNLWQFRPDSVQTQNGRRTTFPECTNDTVFGGQRFVKDIYVMCGINDQTSVPILVDKKTKTVVNNESAEIMRMFATDMRHLSRWFDMDDDDDTHNNNNKIQVPDLYPQSDKAKCHEIDTLNDWIYTNVNNGSYKAGFSSNQDVYEKWYRIYFDSLEKLEDMLQDKPFFTGDTLSESDLRLFPTLYRHDAVYYNRFKLNKRYLWEYPNMWRWMGRMMSLDGLMDDVTGPGYMNHCKQGYFGRSGNGTIPVGPEHYPECFNDPNWATNRQRNNNKHMQKRLRTSAASSSVAADNDDDQN
jgi:glutathionyl-hydroquinone reductase